MSLSLFGGHGKKNYLGVDIGAGGIKVVELLNEKGRARLLTYGYSERRPGEPPAPPLERPKETAELLAKICKRAQTASTRAVAALPLSSVFSTIISVPRDKDEASVKDAIQAQVRKLTPLPLEEMITYSTFIDPLREKDARDAKGTRDAPWTKGAEGKTGTRENVRVLVTGSPKSLVQKYIEIFKFAKLELLALDTEAFALIRSLVGRDKSAVLLLDIGYLRTNITVVEKGIPFLTRSINVGGGMVTQKIMHHLSVSEEEAERMKLDLGGMGSRASLPISGPPAASSAPVRAPAILESAVVPIVNEVRFAMELYGRMDTADHKRVEKIIVTGGSAHLPGLAEHLSQTLNMNVYVGDPWARVIYPDGLRPVLDEVGPRLGVALGLAMREME
jgi:type IV pilus assembly protein PilM